MIMIMLTVWLIVLISVIAQHMEGKREKERQRTSDRKWKNERRGTTWERRMIYQG